MVCGLFCGLLWSIEHEVVEQRHERHDRRVGRLFVDRGARRALSRWSILSTPAALLRQRHAPNTKPGRPARPPSQDHRPHRLPFPRAPRKSSRGFGVNIAALFLKPSSRPEREGGERMSADSDLNFRSCVAGRSSLDYSPLWRLRSEMRGRGRRQRSSQTSSKRKALNMLLTRRRRSP